MFDPILLLSFVTVVETQSFSEAGRRLRLGQSTVSQHIQRLEVEAGYRLFVRDTHTVTLTAEGQAMLGFARTILDANDRARRYFKGSELRSKLRFGACEDFALSRLPDLLYDFTRAHPSIDLELTVALSSLLCEMLDAGQLDLAMAKRRLGDDRGQLVRCERLAWMGREALPIEAGRPIPLVTFPPPSITRAMAIEALEKAEIPWHIACTCGGLIGLRSAALAGFGVMVQPASMVPAGLVELHSRLLPDPGEIEFVLIARTHPTPGPVRALSHAIMQSEQHHLPLDLIARETGPYRGAAILPTGGHHPGGHHPD